MAFKSVYVRDKTTGKVANGADLLTVYTVGASKTFMLRGLYIAGSFDLTVAGGAGTMSAALTPYVLPSGGTDATADQYPVLRDIANGATVVPLGPESLALTTTESGSAPNAAVGAAIALSAASNGVAVARTVQVARFNLTSAMVFNTGDVVKIKRTWQITIGTWDLTAQCMVWGDEF